ncbi:hypothetical protein T492DRAFT_139483 [Pavlovales sp. CCMP2436]|nr:hypothetical protein T492DRAFT_139483 [Pavlovales sp. CCMP2436]
MQPHVRLRAARRLFRRLQAPAATAAATTDDAGATTSMAAITDAAAAGGASASAGGVSAVLGGLLRRGATARAGPALLPRGVPLSLRTQLWWDVSGAGELRDAAGPGAYSKLCARAVRLRSVAAGQIDTDLERTFPEHPLFAKQQTQPTQQQLLHCDEEGAFWVPSGCSARCASGYSPTTSAARCLDCWRTGMFSSG